MFNCILCFSKSKLNKPVELSIKVSEKLTLKECIIKNLNCAPAILDNELDKFACTNCFAEFVNFYEFLNTIEHIYEKISQPKIKTEVFEEEIISYNFVAVPDYSGLLKAQFNIKECFIKLKRIDVRETEDFSCYSNDELNDQCSLSFKDDLNFNEIEQDLTSIILNDDVKNQSRDSDFEWPANDEDFPAILEDQSKHKKLGGKKQLTNEERDNDYDPDKDLTLKPKRRKKKNLKNKSRVGELRHLPRYLLTPEILATEGNLITIDGVTYRIPRTNRHKPIKPKVSRGIKRALDPTRRPHPAWDPEGEQKIRNYVDVRCHVCGEEYLTFHRLKKHVKKNHAGEQGFLVCCNKKFTRRYELIEHLEKHEGTIYQCKFCNDGINHGTMSALRTHIKTNHTAPESKINDNDHICENCGKVYSSESGLKNHMKQHEKHEIQEIDELDGLEYFSI